MTTEDMLMSHPLRNTATTTTFSTDVPDVPDVVPYSLSSIGPILRVANETEHDRPRISYLCQFYAFEKVHRLDRNSIGRGVKQFKTALLRRLERDDAPSLASYVESTDGLEIRSFYQQYYETHVRSLDIDSEEQANRAQLAKVYQTAGVLFEVLCAFDNMERVKEVAPQG